MKTMRWADLTATERRLIQKARAARAAAYAPYSKYAVGAAIQTGGGAVFGGANVENASFGLTVCAERIALFNAVSGGKRRLVALALATRDGAFPCGACRQVLNEFNPRLRILIAKPAGKTVVECRLDELLPESFGPADLKKK